MIALAAQAGSAATPSAVPLDVEGAVAAAVGSGGANCATGAAREITVCGRAESGRSRYRLPLGTDVDPKSIPIDRSRRTGALEEGRSGIGVCAGAVGAAGFTGCSMHEWKRISGKE